MDKYSVAKQFSAGFAAAVLPMPRDSKCAHWLAGWDAGYGFRAAKNERLNEYLQHLGMEPMAKISLAAAPGETKP